MIKPGEIQNKARKFGVRDQQIEKDYILSWILQGIAQNESLKSSYASPEKIRTVTIYERKRESIIRKTLSIARTAGRRCLAYRSRVRAGNYARLGCICGGTRQDRAAVSHFWI